MPFLFDSITGEITESAGEPSLVLHPVILVKHDKNGVADLVGDGSAGKSDPQADRVSLIHVHVARMGEGSRRSAQGPAGAYPVAGEGLGH
jgi:glutamate dehydrogenase